MEQQTRISLKNIKHSEFASQETHCFEASLYFDGKRIGKVGNDGHGGCDWVDVTDQAAFETMQKFINTLPAITCGWDDPKTGKPATVPQCLETICCDLVNIHLSKKDLQAIMRRTAVFRLNGELREIGYKGSRKPDQGLFDHVMKKYPGAEILNNMPIEQAVTIYRAAA